MRWEDKPSERINQLAASTSIQTIRLPNAPVHLNQDVLHKLNEVIVYQCLGLQTDSINVRVTCRLTPESSTLFSDMLPMDRFWLLSSNVILRDVLDWALRKSNSVYTQNITKKSIILNRILYLLNTKRKGKISHSCPMLSEISFYNKVRKLYNSIINIYYYYYKK